MRLTSLRMVQVLALLFLAACGGQTPAPTDPGPQPGSTATLDSGDARRTAEAAASATPTPRPTPTSAWIETAAQLQGRSLDLLHPFTGGQAAALEELAREFSRGNEWGLNVQAQFAGGQAQMDAPLSSGEDEQAGRPALVVGSADQLHTWAANGALLTDLAPLATDPQYGLEGPGGTFSPALDQAVLSGASRLGLPLLASPRVIFYNQGWAQELGFPAPPADLEAFWEQACAAAQANQEDRGRENDGTGGWMVDSEALTMLAWLSAYGVEELTGSGELDYRFLQPAGEDALTGLREQYDEGCAWLGRQPTGYQYFANRMALFISGQAEEIDYLQRALLDAGSEDRWLALPFPGQDGQPHVFADGYYLGVTAGDAVDQLGAWLFARWLVDPARLARLAAAGGSLPAAREAVPVVQRELQGRSEQWGPVFDLADALRVPPARASWQLAAMVLEDAGWHLFQPATTASQVPEMLEMLDETIREVGERQRVGSSD